MIFMLKDKENKCRVSNTSAREKGKYGFNTKLLISVDYFTD